MIEICVAMKPKPKGRPRATKTGRVFTPKTTKDAEKIIANAARTAMCGRKPMTGAVIADVYAEYKIPKSWSRAKKAAHPPGTPKLTVPDKDNIEKLAMDALNDVAFLDDAQVWTGRTTKVWSDRDHLKITLHGE